MSSCLRRLKGSRKNAVSRKGRASIMIELLVLGLEDAGKSLLMRQLCNCNADLANDAQKSIHQIQPTVGVEMYKIRTGRKRRGNAAHAREVGGCMLPVWPQYFADAGCLLYVVDLSATSQLAAAVVELQSLVEHPDLQGKPVCVALSQHSRKQPFLSSGILDHVLGIESLESAGLGLLTVVNISLDTGAGLQKIMQWLNANG